MDQPEWLVCTEGFGCVVSDGKGIILTPAGARKLGAELMSAAGRADRGQVDYFDDESQQWKRTPAVPDQEVWICWGNRIETFPNEDEALSWKYFCENDSDNASCSVIEGPNGYIVSDQEYAVYENQRDLKAKADRARSRAERPLLGKVQIRWPNKPTAWATVEWIYDEALKTETVAKFTALLGADRVQFVPPTRYDLL